MTAIYPGKVLHIPAHTRRAPVKSADYIAKHEQLRSEVEAGKFVESDAFLEQWADIFEEKCRRLPSLRDTMGMT